VEPETLRDIIRNQVKQEGGLNRLLSATVDVLIEYHKWNDTEVYAKAIKHIQKAIAENNWKTKALD
jgi:hypothetical protein